MSNATPMMEQYNKIKEQCPDTILMYRLGDFYEMFYDDAQIASKELELVLTGRASGNNEKAPMCGVPFHSAETYIARLVNKGYKVAICEQTEDPAQAKGKVVKREIIRTISPGTAIDNLILDESRNNYLAVAYVSQGNTALCFVDVSTGKLSLTSFFDKKPDNRIINEITKFSPTEIIINTELSASKKVCSFISDFNCFTCDIYGEEKFDYRKCLDTVTARFGEKKLSEIGISGDKYAVLVLGCCLEYLSEMQKCDISGITDVEYYSDSMYMRIDYWSRKNLELTETIRGRDKKGSLLWVLDKTRTPMGKRLLRDWLERPLVDPVKISNRQNAVMELFDKPIIQSEISKQLCGVYDIERLMSRVLYSAASPKDLAALRETFRVLPGIRELTSVLKCGTLRSIDDDIDTMEDMLDLLSCAIVDEPPATLKEGKVIEKGFNAELDRLKDIDENGNKYIKNMEETEKAKTGIPKLKIGFNRVFGYYIEIPNAFKDNVPEEYMRRQTVSGGERYITDELKKFESEILTAREKMIRLEYEIFCQVRNKIADEYRRIQKTASALSRLDVFCCFARVASENNYVCPEITLDGTIDISDGRHPVVEKMLKDSVFVPNSTYLDCDNNRCAIITGPNMAGKSTYMRQVALISIMSQIGSFVPATRARLSVVDAVFTRIGASDDLAAGSSTFMVEMNEVSDILKNSTKNSLIILDEIGRGTSTFDGMSIARAVLEYVTDKRKLGAKTLFATHYHELTELEEEGNGIRNYNISVKKRGDSITFLRRIIKGKADGSYGIEVAKLAGIPISVVNRARVILSELEMSSQMPFEVSKMPKNTASEDLQISLSSEIADEIYDELKNLDPDTLTPIEALNILYSLIGKVQK